MNRKRFLVFALSACAFLGLSSGIVLLINVQAQVPQQGQIAFLSRRDAIKGEIYVMNEDGTNIRRLTNHPAADWQPDWSPDGQKIAFVSTRDGEMVDPFNYDIYVMDSDGLEKNVHRLTNQPKWNREPAWSPDGKKIAYTHDDGGANLEIYLMDTDGKNPHNLTKHPGIDWTPTWSPDGQKIAFASGRSGDIKIHVMDADGKNVQQLTSGRGSRPAWSPDGQKIAFQANRDGKWDIYVMDSDGLEKNVRRLTKDGTAGEPEWSPDGRQIAFVSYRDGNGEIYMMDADGKHQRNLTNHPASDVWLSWFGSAFTLSVSSAGKQATTWGWLKQNSK